MSEFLERLLDRESLSEEEAAALMDALADDRLAPAAAGAVLAALRAKRETPAEVRGFARALLARAVRPRLPHDGPFVDIVGTGGDRSGSLNLSTGAALLAAAAGSRVPKHGNRAVSSRAGSADTLEALGLRLDEDPGAVLARTGFCFLYAPNHHPAMRAVAPIRRAMGVRTVFNLIGPLVNPARPAFLVLGAFSSDAARLLADALSGMDVQRAYVVHGSNGWDEPTQVAPFLCLEVRPGEVRESTRDAAEFGIAPCDASALSGADAATNAVCLRAALRGEAGPIQDALVLGAALALEAAGVETGPRAAADRARAAIAGGRAAAVLDGLPIPATTPSQAVDEVTHA